MGPSLKPTVTTVTTASDTLCAMVSIGLLALALASCPKTDRTRVLSGGCTDYHPEVPVEVGLRINSRSIITVGVLRLGSLEAPFLVSKACLSFSETTSHMFLLSTSVCVCVCVCVCV